MISLRKTMDEADRLDARFRVLTEAFERVTGELHKTVAPGAPELSRQCKEHFRELVAPLDQDPTPESIEEVGKGVVGQVDEIARSNKATIDEIDGTIKDVVCTVASAISGFKGHGEKHQTNLTRLADGFDSLSRLEDATEMRRRLREEVLSLRSAVDQMRRESEETARQVELRMTAVQHRLEAARDRADIDRLTLLGNRRMAERKLEQLAAHPGSCSALLFDIEDFKEINRLHGPSFGDKLLRVLAHQLRESFPEDDTLFRWGPDEFLAIAEGTFGGAVTRCRSICKRFANANYFTYELERKQRVTASVAWGAVACEPGLSPEEIVLRLKKNLEDNRRNHLI